MRHAQRSVDNDTKLFGTVNVISEKTFNTRSFLSPKTNNDHDASAGNDVAPASPVAAAPTTSLLLGISFDAIIVVVVVVVVVVDIVRRYSDLL